MHYNVHRSYKWDVGGYTQNDPLGLGGGWNRRTYVDSNPLGFSDPKGLLKICAIPGGCIDTNPPPLVGPDYPYPMSTPPSLPSIWSPVIAIPSAIMNGCKALTDWMLSDSGRNKDVPNRAEPGAVIDGNHRTREYGSDGKPLRDYDKPHQGYERPHVHEWQDGVREHPGRDYSPWPQGGS
jgi:uncharacterized protein RhaS with RHS repeats